MSTDIAGRQSAGLFMSYLTVENIRSKIDVTISRTIYLCFPQAATGKGVTESEFKRRAWQHILELVKLLCLYWFNKPFLSLKEDRMK